MLIMTSLAEILNIAKLKDSTERYREALLAPSREQKVNYEENTWSP